MQIYNRYEQEEEFVMIRSRDINFYIQKNILNGAKTPHNTSYPVIIKENGKYYLATFTFFYSYEDIETGMVERPTMWAIADIETGEIIEERLTKDKEFSDASYGTKYNVRIDVRYDASKEYYDRVFEVLDSCRKDIISAGNLNTEKYRTYLHSITANVPVAYRRFYEDLSI